MRRLAFLLSLMMCMGLVVAVATTDVAAQNLVPCCEGGAKPNKRCNTDNNCPGACIGGARDGKNCKDNTNCPGACVGGANDGLSCANGGDCPGACIGGTKDGQPCFTKFECPNGGECSAPGSCGSAGTCDQGTCTGMCQQGKPPKSPSDPASEWLEIEAAGQVTVLHTCP